jgi:hypothetical protein
VNGVGFRTGNSNAFYFGGIPALNAQCQTTTQCTMGSPAHAPGVVQVSYGSSPYTLPFTYNPAMVTSIDPNVGPEGGGTDVNLYGSGFTNTMAVFFDSTQATYGVVCISSSWCTTRSPQGSGNVPVLIQVPGQAKTVTGPIFRYAKYPTVTSLQPTTGPTNVRTSFSIIGTNFDPTPGATTIQFGPNTATNVSCAATLCTGTAPLGSGPVNVTVTVGLVTSQQNVHFTYTSVITSVAPNTGFQSGGDKVSIAGAGFVNAVVFFGPNQAESYSCSTPTACSATSPAGVGAIDVRVVVDGQSGPTNTADRFTYTAGNRIGWTQWQLTPPELSNPGTALTDDPVTREILYLVPEQGTNDNTYAWEQATQGWVLKNVPVNPRPSKGAFAFHQATGKAVLFGGLIDTVSGASLSGGLPGVSYATDNTTWIWDGSNWSIPVLAAAPRARYRASMTYDAAHGKIVLFGGCADYGCVNRLNDTWTWDGVSWKQETPATSPTPRAAAALAYNAANGTTILFGGSLATGLASDTWTWDGHNWTQLVVTSYIPAARLGAGLGYSRADAGLVLYGGRTSLKPVQGTVYFDDTWIWNGSSWGQINTIASPKLTSEITGMTYDTAMDAVVVISNDVIWAWGGAGVQPAPPPPTN